MFTILGSVFAYLFATAMAYRLRYQYTMRGYLRWKNDNPAKQETFPRASTYMPTRMVKRRDISYEDYLRVEGLYGPLAYAMFWPYLMVLFPVDRFVRPPVKIPDIPKIEELEKL